MNKTMKVLLSPEVILGTLGTIFALLVSVGCASGVNGAKQTLTNVSIAVAGGYKTLATTDKVRQLQIQTLAKTNPAEAKMELEDHIRKYDIAWKALNTASTAIADTAKGIAAGKDLTLLVATLLNAATDVDKALTVWGVIK